MLKIHGKKQSRAARCLWVAEEMRLDYQQVPTDTRNGDTRTSEYLALNPAGKVPVLDDDGFALRESMAITLYLVTKSATPLWPTDAKAQALIHQWSSWAVTDMESPLNTIFREKRRTAAAGVEADPAFIADQIEVANKALQQLEDRLKDHSHVVGDAFSLGDVNAYTSAMLAPMFLDMTRYPAVQEWMARCAARPAWQRVQALP